MVAKWTRCGTRASTNAGARRTPSREGVEICRRAVVLHDVGGSDRSWWTLPVCLKIGGIAEAVVMHHTKGSLKFRQGMNVWRIGIRSNTRNRQWFRM